MGIDLRDFQKVRDTFLGNIALDERRMYVAILKCDGCGDIGCWSFQVRVSRNQGQIMWSDYRNGHRDWAYEALPSFTFDIAQYEAEVANLPTI